jgi:hypothetical protein
MSIGAFTLAKLSEVRELSGATEASQFQRPVPDAVRRSV